MEKSKRHKKYESKKVFVGVMSISGQDSCSRGQPVSRG